MAKIEFLSWTEKSPIESALSLKDLVNTNKANLRGANLRGADLSEANLRRADLRRADLRGANLRGADLSEANLRGADLSGANLREANLRGADLRRADLRRANLDMSVLPLWCGGLNFKIDKRVLCQLLYHVCSLEVNGCDEWNELRNSLLPLANQMHRKDVPRLESK